jgi:multidrug efflux pump subunit AcrA (membrane-fusion protein)
MNALVDWMKKYRLRALGALFIVIFVIALLKLRSAKQDFTALADPIGRGSIVESVYGIGTVTAKNTFQLKLGVMSKVRKLFVAEGDHVQRGQKLVELEDSGAFFAPFDGTIAYLPVKAGETVFAQAVVLTLVDLVNRYIVVSLEQRAAVRVHQGQSAKLNFENMREKSFDGTVESLYSYDNNFLVRIGASNLPPQLLPGMTADVSIAVGERQNALVVPTVAIDAGKVYVMRRGGRLETVEIRTGLVDGSMAEVVSGDLHEGDRLYLRKKANP